MDDFEKQMQGWLNKVGGLANLTVEEREEVTQAGAAVLRDKISQNTPRRDRKLGDMEHLADSVVIGRMQGTKADGSTAVGYTKKSKDDVDHARIARFQNDGTVKMPNPRGLHFYDRAISESKSDVFDAEHKKITEIQERKSKS